MAACRCHPDASRYVSTQAPARRVSSKAPAPRASRVIQRIQPTCRVLSRAPDLLAWRVIQSAQPPLLNALCNEREGSPPKTHKALATASESDRRSFALNMRAWWHTWSGALDDTLCAVEGHAAMTRCAWAKGMLAMTGRAHHRMASSSFALASVHARVRACQQCGSSGSARRMKTVE